MYCGLNIVPVPVPVAPEFYVRTNPQMYNVKSSLFGEFPHLRGVTGYVDQRVDRRMSAQESGHAHGEMTHHLRASIVTAQARSHPRDRPTVVNSAQDLKTDLPHDEGEF